MRAKKYFWLWIWMLGILMGVVSACIPGIEQGEPIIVLDPNVGGPGTSITVSGSGFPPGIELRVRLGPPSVGASPLSYGEATADAEGRFSLAFTMPLQWPDGTLVVDTDLVVVVLNEDGSVKATAPFGYIPPLSGISMPVPGTVQAHQRAILTWHRQAATGLCGDVRVYENGYVEIDSCREGIPLARRLLSEDETDRLRDWAEAYQSFEVEQIKGTGESRVLTRVAFVGNGSRQVSKVEMQTIQALLETLASSQ
jgi:hypothetical protein